MCVQRAIPALDLLADLACHLLPQVPELWRYVCNGLLDMAANVATRPPSIDRKVSTTGCKDRSVPMRYHMCRRLSRAGHAINHGKGRRHICNSAEPDWDAEMSLFRKRSMKPNQMQTIRRLEEEVDIGKVPLLE